jgi:hypothetical protein
MGVIPLLVRESAITPSPNESTFSMASTQVLPYRAPRMPPLCGGGGDSGIMQVAFRHARLIGALSFGLLP